MAKVVWVARVARVMRVLMVPTPQVLLGRLLSPQLSVQLVDRFNLWALAPWRLVVQMAPPMVPRRPKTVLLPLAPVTEQLAWLEQLPVALTALLSVPVQLLVLTGPWQLVRVQLPLHQIKLSWVLQLIPLSPLEMPPSAAPLL